MASFAELDNNNKVINIIKISNEEILDNEGNESEALGIQRCKDLFGKNKRWVQTFYGDTETSRRGNPATIGGYYLKNFDAFTRIKYHSTWILNTKTLTWDPPVPVPPLSYENPITYEWDNETISWKEVEIPKPESTLPNIDYKWNKESASWVPFSIPPE